MSELERAKVLFGQGLQHYAAGHYSEAEQRFKQANELAPDRLSILGNLSAALLRQDKIAEAKTWALKALSLDAGNFEACMNLGACLQKEKNPAEALALFEKASALKPDSAEAWSNRGQALGAMKRHRDALAHYEKAIALHPGHAEAWTNRGNALNELGRLAEALASHDKALALQPRLAEAWYNRGNALSNLKQFPQALDSYQQVLAIAPDHADAHFNKSLALLSQCEFLSGWAEYEWRWKSANFPSRPLVTDIPEWGGQAFAGSLLVWAEQGIGDEILYAGMLEELQSQVERLAVTMDPRLIPLFQRSLPEVRFLPRDTPLPSRLADRQIAMGSLGRYLRRQTADFPPARDGYLKPDQQRAAGLRNRISIPGKRVLGLSWGSKNARMSAIKSLRLQDLLPVLSLADTTAVDLQYGDTLAERRMLEETADIAITHLDDIDNFHDIDGLAALIHACDAVVTISNVTAHLAGAMGKPTFLLAPWSKGKIWYWHEGHSRSLWYPSVRLYLQGADDRWNAAIEAVAAELTAEMERV